jgi:hypothetical protein
MKGLKGLRVCRTAYLAHRIPVWFRCGAVPNGPRETGARKLRPGWCKGPVGTEGGKPRPDYGLPNLTPRTLNVVNVLGRVFKPHPGGLVRFGVQGRWQSDTPPPKISTASSQGHRRRCIVASTKPEANSSAGVRV